MSRRADTLAVIALVALSLSVPTALAAWLLSGPEGLETRGTLAPAAAPAADAARGVASDAVPAGTPGMGSAPAAGATAPVTVIGMLYTRGKASVDWNGVEIPVENGTYAYVGGETIAIGPEAMGVLRLADGSSVFLCPDSRARLEVARDGTFALSVLSGTGRFMFQPGRAFAVDAGGVAIDAPEGPSSETLIGEVVVPEHGGCVLCALRGTLGVAGAPAAAAGQIVRIAPDGSASFDDIPGAFAAAFGPGNLALAGAGDLPFLCRCREIDRYARGEGQEVPAEARIAPPGGGTGVPSAPPVEPPGLPAIALAVPGAPDPFDPNVLPPPAAGPTTTTFTVPPPLVPTGGNGGGSSASPS